MKATYEVTKTCDFLIAKGTAPYYVEYIVDGVPDWDYDRRAKHFYETEAKAHEAGKRYLRKMKKNGFEIGGERK